MNNKKIIILSVILAIIIVVISIFSIRYARKNKEDNITTNNTITESLTEESTENVANVTEKEIENVTEETVTETTTEKVTEKTAITEPTTEKQTETTTKKKVETTTKRVETTTKKPETTTLAPVTMFTANLPVSSPTALELALFDAINAERENAGIAKLKWNDNLHFFARKRAEEVIVTKGHTRPNGTKFYTIFKEYGVTNTNTSENLAYGRKESSTLVSAYVDAWMASSGHRNAILDSSNKYAAMGVAIDSDGTVYAVTLFHK